MNKELKIRIAQPASLVQQLQSIGATHTRDTTYEYIYFNQPKGAILKLTKKDGKIFKTVMEQKGKRFVIKSSDELPNPREVAEQLAKQYGFKRHLVNHRQFYTYKKYKLSINDIEGVGAFLIVEGTNPKIDFVINELGIKNPEVVTDSFDNL